MKSKHTQLLNLNVNCLYLPQKLNKMTSMPNTDQSNVWLSSVDLTEAFATFTEANHFTVHIKDAIEHHTSTKSHEKTTKDKCTFLFAYAR